MFEDLLKDKKDNYKNKREDKKHYEIKYFSSKIKKTLK